jgi:hypothetical protein
MDQISIIKMILDQKTACNFENNFHVRNQVSDRDSFGGIEGCTKLGSSHPLAREAFSCPWNNCRSSCHRHDRQST